MVQKKGYLPTKELKYCEINFPRSDGLHKNHVNIADKQRWQVDITITIKKNNIDTNQIGRKPSICSV